MIGRYQLKVILTMMFIALVPIVSSVFVVDALLRDTLSLGLNQRVERSFEHAADGYRAWMRSEKGRLLTISALLVHQQPIKSISHSWKGEESLKNMLPFLTSFGNRHKSIESIIIEGPGLTAPYVLVINKARDKEKFRFTQIKKSLAISETKNLNFTIRFATPWTLFHRFKELGEIKRTYKVLVAEQEELGSSYRMTYIVLSGVVLFITLIIAALTGRQITGRVKILSEATQALAAGDLTIHIPVKGRDEIAALMRSFNSMVLDLQEVTTRVQYLERVSAWQDIARRLAHEIKNPLTPILLSTQQLNKKIDTLEQDPESYKRMVREVSEIVTEEVETLTKLVNEFRDFARLPKVEPKLMDLRSYLDEFLRTNPQFQDRTILENKDKDKDTIKNASDLRGALINADKTLLRRVLVNLVRNGIEAMEENQSDGKVCLTVNASETTVRLMITDEGPGIPAKKKARIFEPYFTTKTEGTGLGLAIVKKIILDHKGDIEATDGPDNKGTSFVLNFPACPDILREDS